MIGVLINKNHDMVDGKDGIYGLNSSYKMYESDDSLHNIPLIVMSDITVGGGMNNVPLKPRPMRIHHDIPMSSGENS